MMQVGLTGANVPDEAAYAQHGDDEVCSWPGNVETLGGRPIVYVAQGSHASYFHPGHYDDPDPDDDADGQGIEVTSPVLTEVSSMSSGWMRWPGRWGDNGGDSPPGPAFQPGLKWPDPSAWAYDQRPCDVS